MSTTHAKANPFLSKPQTKEGVVAAILTTLSIISIFLFPIITLLFRLVSSVGSQDNAQVPQFALGCGVLIPVTLVLGIIGIVCAVIALKKKERSVLMLIPLTVCCLTLLFIVLLIIAEFTFME